MGAVYEARQKSLKRRVALKVLSSGLGLTAKAVMRFRREAICRRIAPHEYCPYLLDGRRKRHSFLRHEPVQGPSLDRVLRQFVRNEHRSTKAVGSQHRRYAGTVSNSAVGHAKHRTGIPTSPSSSGVAALGDTSTSSSNAERADCRQAGCRSGRRPGTRTQPGVHHRDIKPSNLLLSPEETRAE